MCINNKDVEQGLPSHDNEYMQMAVAEQGVTLPAFTFIVRTESAMSTGNEVTGRIQASDGWNRNLSVISTCRQRVAGQLKASFENRTEKFDYFLYLRKKLDTKYGDIFVVVRQIVSRAVVMFLIAYFVCLKRCMNCKVI